MQKRKVIIVGGGLAGLSAAYELSAAEGFDIHLIEKDERLGGRVHTCIVNGQGVDVGGFLVYPWYKRYHQLISELGLTEELIQVPDVSDYYAGKENSQEEYHEGFKLSFKEVLKIFLLVFPKPLIDSDPTAPELHAYDDLTIADYLKSLHLRAKKATYYLNVFDTYLQGYCYGSVAEHKMAFMASTLFQNMKHGDVHSASYLRNGSRVFIDSLKETLEKRGVQIHLNCALEAIENGQLITGCGAMSAADFIFCQRPPDVHYTSFITATVSYSGIARIAGDADWGSCFYKEESGQSFPILSIVNLEKLYTAKTAGHLNLNIKVNKQQQPAISSDRLLQLIKDEMRQHFNDITITALVNRVDWEQAMPIASENYVDSIRTNQGQQHFYYAGDFMGCPSMETALMHGMQAAAQLISNTGR